MLCDGGPRSIVPCLLAPGASQRATPPRLVHLVIGIVTNFFDTLGIGSFVTTTSTYKLLGLVPDERIPGTMLVGHTLPVVVQAFAFISIVSVDRTLLVSLIVAMMAGGWLGAGVVSRLPRRVDSAWNGCGAPARRVLHDRGAAADSIRPVEMRWRSNRSRSPSRGLPTSSLARSRRWGSATTDQAWSSSACSGWTPARRFQS